jgi:glycosyltransferase involved in cell wall biosynthesis
VFKSRKVLFVSHQASRTGAPIVLTHLLKWLKAEQKFDISIYIKERGPLEGAFKSISTTYLPYERNLVQRAFRKGASKLLGKTFGYKLPKPLLQQTFDLIYLNTVESLELASLLKKAFNCPIICHVHENSFTINHYYPHTVKAANLLLIDYFIAASKSTAENLICSFNIAPEKINVIYECICLKDISRPTITENRVKAELGINGEFIIGGSGLTIWRKGIDLFIQLAVRLNQLQPKNNIKLVWIGTLYPEFVEQYKYEADRLGIGDKIIFTGSQSTPQNYFQIFDVFTLTSREDPFPLVVLEAAALRKPIICFEGAGGIPELIENDKGGIVVPYADIDAMAKQILLLKDQEDRLVKMGKDAENLIQDFDVNVVGKQWVSVIEKILNN